MPIAISDSSTLIHLSALGRLELLREFFDEILVPPAAWREVVEQGQGRSGALEVEAARRAGWVRLVTPFDKRLVLLLRRELDAGESEAITLALEQDNGVLLLDETEVRRVARLYELRITGVIGILLRAHRKGKIVLATELQKLREEADFWISDTLHAQVLAAANAPSD